MHSIQELSLDDIQLYADHLLRLSPNDRFVRFGHHATDDQIAQYLDAQFRSQQAIIGVKDHEGRVIAAIELVYDVSRYSTNNTTVEIGLTVEPQHRGIGIGTRLLSDAAHMAQTQGAKALVCHCLDKNPVIQSIVRKLGLNMNAEPQNAESCSRRFGTLMAESMAVWDYTVTRTAKFFNYGAIMTFAGSYPQ